MSIGLHCDREGCDTWARGGHVTQFLTLTCGAYWMRHFCCLDCCMRWAAANSEPTEVANG